MTTAKQKTEGVPRELEEVFVRVKRWETKSQGWCYDDPTLEEVRGRPGEDGRAASEERPGQENLVEVSIRVALLVDAPA